MCPLVPTIMTQLFNHTFDLYLSRLAPWSFRVSMVFSLALGLDVPRKLPIPMKFFYRRLSKILFASLPQINMGADPIIKSAKERQGCRHSNHGGK